MSDVSKVISKSDMCDLRLLTRSMMPTPLMTRIHLMLVSSLGTTKNTLNPGSRALRASSSQSQSGFSTTRSASLSCRMMSFCRGQTQQCVRV